MPVSIPSAESSPPIEIIGGVRVASADRPEEDAWRALAQQTGVGPYLPVVLSGRAQLDHYRPGGMTNAEYVPQIETQQPPPAKYCLGSVAVEAAGVFRADSLPGEVQTRERYNRFLGSVAMHASRDEYTDVMRPAYRSSLDLLRAAAAGDEASREALLNNNRTHVYEIFGGVGESMTVGMKVDAAGRIVSAGQTTEDRQFHTLTSYTNQHPEVRRAAHIEGLSGFRLEDRRRDGHLHGQTVFDFSPIPQAARQDLAGYFLNSITLAIRANRFIGNECKMDSVFIGGVDQRLLPPRKRGETEAEEFARQELALELRFDIRVLRKMYTLFGVEGAADMSATDILAMPMVAPDTFDALDIAMLYDVLATEELGDEARTFFGSVELWEAWGSPARLTRKHYEAYMQEREARQARYDSLCQAITDEQIRRHAEAATPMEAVDLERQIVLDFAVSHAAKDEGIDATRFGRAAAELIDDARHLFAQGDDIGGKKLVEDAKAVAQDSSCPPGERDKPASDSAKKADDCREVKNGDIVKCPYCFKDVKADVPKKGGKIYCGNGGCKAARKRDHAVSRTALSRSGKTSKPRSWSILH
jgi:hypothetical protein